MNVETPVVESVLKLQGGKRAMPLLVQHRIRLASEGFTEAKYLSCLEALLEMNTVTVDVVRQTFYVCPSITLENPVVIGTKDFEAAIQTDEIETATDKDLIEDFNRRADRWEKETAILSAPAAMYLQRDYMVIIAKGTENPEAIIPLILKRLSVQGGDWFFALEKITGENPAQACEDYGDALRAWLEWAQDNGFIKEGDALLRA